MPFKNLLVHIDETKANANRLQAALALARAQEAHLTGLYVINESDLPSYAMDQVFRHVIEQQRAAAEEVAQAAAKAFLADADRQGVTADTRVERILDHQVAALIARDARYVDLVIAGQNEPDDPGPGGRHVVEDLVLSAGRPVLVIPYIGARRPIGRTVTVAWDAGRAAARAVADAMPLLETAGKVHVFIVNPVSGIDAHGVEPGADITLSLARHDINAEVHTTTAQGIEEGEAILSWLSDSGSDLLVMGAYGHARLRELLLGGVTRCILQSMTVPVFMSH